MQKLREMLLKFLIAILFIIGGIGILQSLSKLPELPQLQTAKIKEILEPITQETAEQKALLEKETLIVQRVERKNHYLRLMEERTYIKEDIAIEREVAATKRILRTGWGYALIGAFLFLFAGVGFGLCFAIVKLSMANSDVIVLAFLSRKLTPGMERIELEKLRIMHEELKLWGLTKDAPELGEMKDITPPAKIPDALECLNRGMMSGGNPSFFLATDKNGESVYEDILTSETGIALLGGQGFGKSNFMVNLDAQAKLKGFLTLIIDLHFPHKKSLVYAMGKLADAPNCKYFHTRDKALEAMWFVNQLVQLRLDGTIPTDIPIFVFVDELLKFIQMFQQEKELIAVVMKAFTALTTEGRGLKMYLVAGSHDWKVESIGSSTFRQNMFTRVIFCSDKRSVRTFTGETKYAYKAKHLRKGEIILDSQYHDAVEGTVPLWTPQAIDKAASMVKEVAWPDIAEPNQEQLDQYQADVVKLSDYRTDLKRQAANLKYGECQDFAKKHGIDPHTVSRWRNKV